jgi:hypothetical protein
MCHNMIGYHEKEIETPCLLTSLHTNCYDPKSYCNVFLCWGIQLFSKKM